MCRSMGLSSVALGLRELEVTLRVISKLCKCGRRKTPVVIDFKSRVFKDMKEQT